MRLHNPALSPLRQLRSLQLSLDTSPQFPCHPYSVPYTGTAAFSPIQLLTSFLSIVPKSSTYLLLISLLQLAYHLFHSPHTHIHLDFHSHHYCIICNQQKVDPGLFRFGTIPLLYFLPTKKYLASTSTFLPSLPRPAPPSLLSLCIRVSFRPSSVSMHLPFTPYLTNDFHNATPACSLADTSSSN